MRSENIEVDNRVILLQCEAYFISGALSEPVLSRVMRLSLELIQFRNKIIGFRCPF